MNQRYSLREAKTIGGGRFPKIAKLVTRELKKLTGLKVAALSPEKLRKQRVGNIYSMYFTVGKTKAIRLNFLDKMGESMESIEYWAKGIRFDHTFQEDEDDSLLHVLEELALVIKQGPKSNNSELEFKKGKPNTEPKSLPPKGLDKEMTELLKEIKNSERDLRAAQRDLKDYIITSYTLEGPKIILITGTPGVGKSYVTKNTMKQDLGLSEATDGGSGGYVFISGTVTAASVYRTLYRNKDQAFIIFDDTDAIMQDLVMVNFLKAAVDETKDYTVNYPGTALRGKADADIEPSFVNNANILIISNLFPENLKYMNAVMSRGYRTHFDIDPAQLLDYILDILEHIMPKVDMKLKKKAYLFFKENYNNYSKTPVDIRTLKKTIEFFVAAEMTGKDERWIKYHALKSA